jgi:hypothetical protein
MAYVGTPIDTRNQFQSLQGKRFNGDGSTTAFTLDVAPGNVLDIEVFVGNVRQDPNSAYTLSGTTLTFTGAPPSGTNNIYVVHQAKSVGTIDVPALGVSTASIQTDAITEAKIADDAVESEHLNNNIISGQTELAATPATTDELLISDGGTIKRIDSVFFQNRPAFWVAKNASQNIAGDQNVQLTYEEELLDSAGAFASNTFTPQSAGYYFIYAQARFNANDDADQWRIELYKNDASVNVGSMVTRTQQTAQVSGIVQFNGSSDNLKFYVYHNLSGTTIAVQDQNSFTYAFGFKLIGL